MKTCNTCKKSATKKKTVQILLSIMVLTILVFSPDTVWAIGNYGVNLASAAYQTNINPFFAAGYGGRASDGYDGECTWYAWGRAYEKLGVSLPCRGNATNWTSEASNAGYSTGTSARANSIMVEHYPNGGTGHVFFVEKVENGYAYVTEGNWLGYYHEDAINLSTHRRESWQSHAMGSIDYIYLSSDPSASFSSWSDSKYTYIKETDAAIGQKISASGGTLTKYGIVLYNSNGTELARAADSTSSWSNNPGTVFFKINAECGYTLAPGTTYKYKFYAVVGGKTIWSSMQSFTTPGTASVSATFSAWNNSNYTYVGETDASIGQKISVSGGTLTQYGMVLYDSNGTELARASDSTSSWSNNPGTVYFKVNAECKYTLTPGTTYKYKFYAIISGVTRWSSMQSFTTNGTASITATFSPWSNSNYTYISDTDAAIGQQIYISGGTLTQYGMVLYDSNGTELARAADSTSNWSNDPGRVFFKINQECGYTLMPGTTYNYRFFVVINGVTKWSSMQNFKTTGTSPIVKPSISWTESNSFPSKYSALLCVKANSSVSADFSEATIKIWDENGTLVASKTENDSINTLTSLPIWYDVYSETGSMLVPSSNYTYQFTTKANGYEFNSPVYSFVTESESQNHYGIDVSAHQENIDWATTSNYIDFAIIRCGYGSDYYANDDGQWINNVTACETYGIPYGVYLYSYAETTQEAESEAEHVLRLLAGHKPSLPIYLDLEDNNTVGKLSNDQVLAQTKAFCNKLQKAGFKAGVYASKSWWDNKLTNSEYNEYDKWVAIYSGSFANSMNNCSMWQYTSSGKVPGISTNVDLNYRNENVAPVSQCSHDVTSYRFTIQATCENPGYEGDIYCDKCGYFIGKGNTIKPLGHDFTGNAEYCRRGCGTANPNYDSSENPCASGHTFGSWTTTKKATEIAKGTKTRTCSVCGETETQVIEQLKPTLTSVKISKLTAGKKSATVKWKKISKKKLKKISKIQIQYSTSKDFSKNVKTKYASAKKTSYKIKSLKKDKRYYVRIRAYKKTNGVVHVSKWSKTKSVKAK